LETKKEAKAPFCYLSFFLKNATVFSQAAFAAGSSYRGVL
jgi:hypothetical protein